MEGPKGLALKHFKGLVHPLDTILFLSLHHPLLLLLLWSVQRSALRGQKDSPTECGYWTGNRHVTEVGTEWDSGAGTQLCACGVCIKRTQERCFLEVLGTGLIWSRSGGRVLTRCT